MIGMERSIAADGGDRQIMWLRNLGVLSLAVLSTNGLAFGQGVSVLASGGPNTASFDWLSPSRLAWVPVEFNWADLPIKLYVVENAGYNSNILNLYPGQQLHNGLTPGDRFVRTDIGFTTKVKVEAQELFADLDYTTTNYLHDKDLDLHNHFFDGGVNWVMNSHCNGTLKLINSVMETAQEQLIASGQDISTVQSINETSQCHLYQDINVLISGGATTTRHSQAFSQQLDNNTAYVQSGLQYAWTGLDNIELLLKYSYTHYVNEIGQTTQYSVPPYVRLLTYQVLYNNTISPMVNFSVMGGLTQDVGINSPGNNSGSTPAEPIYALTLNYLPSDKLSLTGSVSRSVSAPTSIIANTQVNTGESVSLRYSLTPKVSLTATVGVSTTAGSNVNIPGVFGANTLLSTQLKAAYEITRFTSLTASVQNQSRETNGQRLRTEIIMMGLDFRPY